MKTVQGIIVDVVNRKQFPGEVHFENGKIKEIKELTTKVPEQYIMPGFVDSHIHIESSMLIPSEFARLAIPHGTVATVSDPHEIANVCGIEGVDYMIENGNKVPLKFYFGAPSCVPATPFETAGATLDVSAVEKLLERDDILYLAEMMNWPGVLNDDPDVLAKIKKAKEYGKPVDGHAPGLKADNAKKYASAGITTDHECFTIEGARDKLAAGMKIAIREGSAAKNYNALIPLLGESPERIMFCSDDKHPDDLVLGHINQLAARSTKLGYDIFDTLRACSVHAIEHYGLDVGLLQAGDPADFIVVDDIESFHVTETWIDGNCVYQNNAVQFDRVDSEPINNFTAYSCTTDDFQLRTTLDSASANIPVIVAEDGELMTKKELHTLQIKDGALQPDVENDILKVVVVNRYKKAPPAVGFIKNFGIKNGAIASSVAHDSHNIIAVGSSDQEITEVVNGVMDAKGGVAATKDGKLDVLALPVGGIMSNRPGEEVAKGYQRLSKTARAMGSELNSPFMTISFMALLVIPSLKMSDLGLFDGDKFEFVEI